MRSSLSYADSLPARDHRHISLEWNLSRTMADLTKVRVFCSYAHEDETFRAELARHLSLLEDSGTIGGFEFWWDGLIAPGQDWNAAIDAKLRDAQVIVFLVSVDFLSSQFVREVELPLALSRHEEGSAVLIAVLLRWVLWENSALGKLQALPDGLRPVESWPSRDLAYTNICEGILKAIVRSPGKSPARAAPRPLASFADFVMESALPRQVTVRKRVVLVVLVRNSQEMSLGDLLELESSYPGVVPEDVTASKVFPLDFSDDTAGNVKPREVAIRLETTDFRVENKHKVIEVHRDSGNEPCVFILEPLRDGPLLLNVELMKDGRRVAGSLLQSVGVASKSSTFQVASIHVFGPDTVLKSPAAPAAVPPPRHEGAFAGRDIARDPNLPDPQSPALPPPIEGRGHPFDFTQSFPAPKTGRSWAKYAATFSLVIAGLLGFLVAKRPGIELPKAKSPSDNLPSTAPPAKAQQASFQSFDLTPEMQRQDLVHCLTAINGRTVKIAELSTGIEGVCYLNALESDGAVTVRLSVVGPLGPVVVADQRFAKRVGFRFRTNPANETWPAGSYVLSLEASALQGSRTGSWSVTFTVS